MTDKIPTSAAEFKTWADRACVIWPAELQKQAWHAWDGLERGDTAEFEKFKIAYSQQG